MRILIAEDDIIACYVLRDILSSYGRCDAVINDIQAIQAFRLAWEENRPYDLICINILMPKMGGLEAMELIRKLENLLGVDKLRKVKVIMITTYEDSENITDSYVKEAGSPCMVKSINRKKIHEAMRNLGLIPTKIYG